MVSRTGSSESDLDSFAKLWPHSGLEVSVKPNLGIGVVHLPHMEVVEPGDRRFIALSEAEDVVKLPGSITVTWRLTYGNGPFKESKVSTTDVKREAVSKQTKRPKPYLVMPNRALWSFPQAGQRPCTRPTLRPRELAPLRWRSVLSCPDTVNGSPRNVFLAHQVGPR